jgi:oligoribonuclease
MAYKLLAPVEGRWSHTFPVTPAAARPVSKVHPQNLAWIDLEMTGLDPQNDFIIEIATVVTDQDLHVLAKGPVLAIHQPPDALARMDAWNRKQHGESGLIERVKASLFDEPTAEQQTLSFLSRWIPPGESPMCGNSICQDRRFLARVMPELEAFFHYRNLDVSTLKILAQRWAPHLMDDFVKRGSHQALDDILESIAELRFYRQHFLRY